MKYTDYTEVKKFQIEFPDRISWTVFNLTRFLLAIKQTGGTIIFQGIWLGFLILFLLVFIVIDIAIFAIEFLIIRPVYGLFLLFVFISKKTLPDPIKKLFNVLAFAVAMLFIFMLINTGYWRVLYEFLKIITEKFFSYAL